MRTHRKPKSLILDVPGDAPPAIGDTAVVHTVR